MRVYFGPPRGGPGTPDPAQITWTYATLGGLLMTAYDVKAYQISGPPWMNAERYDIVAKVPAGTTKEQVRAMWQNLLAERFGVVLHREPKDFHVEELVVAKGGLKIKETAEDTTPSMSPDAPAVKKTGQLAGPGMVSMIFPGATPKAHTEARAQPIAKLTEMLSNQLNHPVIDKTGLPGKYDFTLDFSLRTSTAAPPDPNSPADNASDPGPDITVALQQQLGLRLVPTRATLDVLVIDKAERKPVAN